MLGFISFAVCVGVVASVAVWLAYPFGYDPDIGYVAILGGVCLFALATPVAVLAFAFAPLESWKARCAIAAGVLLVAAGTPIGAVMGVGARYEQEVTQWRRAIGLCEGILGDIHAYHEHVGAYPRHLEDAAIRREKVEELESAQVWYYGDGSRFAFGVPAVGFLARRYSYFDSRLGCWIDETTHPDEWEELYRQHSP